MSVEAKLCVLHRVRVLERAHRSSEICWITSTSRGLSFMPLVETHCFVRSINWIYNAFSLLLAYQIYSKKWKTKTSICLFYWHTSSRIMKSHRSRMVKTKQNFKEWGLNFSGDCAFTHSYWIWFQICHFMLKSFPVSSCSRSKETTNCCWFLFTKREWWVEPKTRGTLFFHPEHVLFGRVCCGRQVSWRKLSI